MIIFVLLCYLGCGALLTCVSVRNGWAKDLYDEGDSLTVLGMMALLWPVFSVIIPLIGRLGWLVQQCIKVKR